MFNFTAEENNRFKGIITDFQEINGDDDFIDFSSLDTIKFLVEVEYPWDDCDLLRAIQEENEDVCDLLLSNGCILSLELFEQAVRLHDVDVLIWLKKRGCDTNPRMPIPLSLLWEALNMDQD